MQDSYRLIWFQHLHKSAGTLIVNMAIENGEVLYSPNGNGNPKKEDGSVLPLWEYNDNDLTNFIDECEAKGVTFIATEHGSPNFNTLINDSRVFLLTCLRDPLERCASNFNYAYYSGYTDCNNIREFSEKPNIYMSDNYYTRIFSNNEQLSLNKIGKKEYSKAIKTLTEFNLVLSTDKNHMDLLTCVRLSIGWEMKNEINHHATFGDYWKIIDMIKKLNFKKLLRYISKKNMALEIEYMKSRYDYDYILIDELFNELLQD